MKRLVLLSTFLLSIALLNAQQLNLRTSNVWTLNKYHHDFGLINQSNGEVVVDFQVSNPSNPYLLIKSVTPECSCTEPTFTESRISKGQSGIISVGYRADLYSGAFTKKIEVITNLDTFDLEISGKVIPKPLSDLEKEFPVNKSGLRLKNDIFTLTNVFDHQDISKEFMVYNSTNTALKLKLKADLPPFLVIDLPSQIAAKSYAKVKVEFIGKQISDYGHYAGYFPITVNQASEELTVMANVSPFVPKIVEGGTYPLISFEQGDLINLGKIPADTLLETKVTIKNIGTANLNLLQVKPACRCIIAGLDQKKVIEPNASLEVSLFFDTASRSGKTRKSVYFYSNDPSSPAQILRIEANIEK